MKVDLPEELKTERFVMKPLVRGDKDAWLEFILSEETLKYISFIKATEDDCVQWIERQLKRYEQKQGGLYALYLGDVLIGQCGLLVQNIDGEEELEIGYHLLPAYQGKGYATEAAKAWKNYAFRNRLSNSVVSMIHVDNTASQKVALNNGMIVDKQTAYMDLPVLIYRINYADWLQEQEPEKIA